MNAKLFLEAMNEVDDRYYEEAAGHFGKRHRWAAWSAAAACLAAVVLTAFSALQSGSSPQHAPPPNAPNGVVDGSLTKPGASRPHIPMSRIVFNELTSPTMDAARRWRDPDQYDEIVWDRRAVIDYYGKDLTPPYVPDELMAAPNNGTALVVLDQGGGIVEDTVGLSFYHAYYEDGSPKLTEGVAAPYGFRLTASKLGLLNCCLYRIPEDEAKTTHIAGTAVAFGHCSMPYGPYDPETHSPSGCYDLYVAEFEQDGIEYQIVADQMEAEEFVKVTASLICGEEVILDW